MKSIVILIAITVSLSIILTLFMLKKIKKAAVFLIVLLTVSIGANALYLLDSSFRIDINKILGITANHKYIIDNTKFLLPLPAKTSLMYRTSDTSAVYLSGSSVCDIIRHFKYISDINTFFIARNNKNRLLIFKYNNNNIYINIDRSENSKKLFIEIE